MDYRVQAGDTLAAIARRFDVTLAAVEAANPQIAEPDKIFPNELVHVPTATAPATGPVAVPPHVVTYLVQPGDTMSGIAATHDVSLAALLAANPQVTNPALIHPGEPLNIPGAGSNASARLSTAPVAAAASIPVGSVTYAQWTGGGEVDAWVRQACTVLGIPSANWLIGYRVLCRRESSGRANAINHSDSNAHGALQADGFPLHCSRGVAQCIPDTFAAYHAAGTSTSIYDPIANIAASMRYVMSRYGVRSDGSNLTFEVQQADANRSPRGY